MKIDVKICGLTNVEDAKAALAAGADFIGFVLYPRSPRGIGLEDLERILRELPASAKAVAVVVNVDRAYVERLLDRCRLHAVQFHGDEGPEMCRAPGGRVWRAVARRDGAWVPDPESWAGAERLVVDAAAPRLYGGSGERADWASAATLAAGRKVMLAGGLNPGNVAAALRAVRPAGVDVASGVESAPGRKDHAAVREFVAAARRAEQEL